MIEITRPLMTLLDEFGEPVDGVSKSASEVEAMEKASKLPDGTYYLTRPNAKIVVDRGVEEPEPEPTPDPEPEPEPDPAPIPGNTIFEWDGQTLSQWRSELPNGHEAEALSVVDDPVNPGRKAIQTRQDLAWGQDQNGKYRVEIKAPNGIFLEDGKEYVLEWETFMADNENNRALIAMDKPNCSHCQFHNMDVTGTSQIHYRAGNYVGNFGMYGSGNLGKINLGAWDKIKIHVKVSTKGDGFCKIWLNSAEPVYSKTGQNLKTGDSRLNYKLGVYCGPNEWVNVTYRRQLYTAMKIRQV